MKPFDRAWAVLKSGMPEGKPLGAGAFRSVYFSDAAGPSFVDKFPHPSGKSQWTGKEHGGLRNLQFSNIATANALKEMGYPFAGEVPVRYPDRKGVWEFATRQPLAISVGQSGRVDPVAAKVWQGGLKDMTFDERRDAWRAFDEDIHRNEFINQFLQGYDMSTDNMGRMRDNTFQVLDPMFGIHGQQWGEIFPPTRQIGSFLEAQEKDKDSYEDAARRLQTFTTLFSDRSQFDPWMRSKTDDRTLDERYGQYLNHVRDMQRINQMVQDPEQMSLLEFPGYQGMDGVPSSYYAAEIGRVRDQLIQARDKDKQSDAVISTGDVQQA